jgi:hypothetical protein
LTVLCACAPATVTLNAAAARPAIAMLRSMMFSFRRHPEERALARVSKDILRDAVLRTAPQDKVRRFESHPVPI